MTTGNTTGNSNTKKNAPIFFRHKFTGYQARLFADACEGLMETIDAGSEVSDEENIPIFIGLTAGHRTFLISQLVVGLLCENEPLPPQKIEYAAAFYVVVGAMKFQVACETDDVLQSFGFDEVADIGKDLLKLYFEPYNNSKRKHEEAWMKISQDKPMAEKEAESYMSEVKTKLVGRVAEKNKKKLDRKIVQQQQKEQTSETNDDTTPDTSSKKAGSANKTHVGNVNSRPQIFDFNKSAVDIDKALSLFHKYSYIYQGGKCPENVRRPPRVLTDKEKEPVSGFGFRLIADKALQEDLTIDDDLIWLPRPLAEVNFCWHSFDTRKWELALEVLYLVRYLRLTAAHTDLIFGEIDDMAYADKSKHARIMIIEKTVKELRHAFDPMFDVKVGAYPQRMIYAICSHELYGGKANRKFIKKFVETCQDKGINLAVGNKFQKRYEIFQEVSDQVPEGIDQSFIYNCRFTDPTKEEPYNVRLLYASQCGNRSDLKCNYLPSSEGELMICSKCHVVRYCSRECQKRDWKVHKKICKDLAVLLKDKEKLQEVIKD